MGEASSEPCVVWYVRHAAPDYELADDEADAARQAFWIEEQESGSVSGVQFRDGRLVKVEEWAAYADEERRQGDIAQQRAASPPPPRPGRQVADPFTGQVLTVDADEPIWLGARTDLKEKQ